MPLDKGALIKQIDDVLSKCDAYSNDHSKVGKDLSMMLAAIRRLAPPGTIYANIPEEYGGCFKGGFLAMSMALAPVRGVLEALKNDYESGYLQSVVELVHAETFSDFLEMAGYLLEQGYKDPAAVIVGSVLEAHLRKLCDKQGITVTNADRTPRKADTLNSELTVAGEYSKLDQKSVTAWLDLRNKAAHGKYAEYTREQVTLMLQGVQDFVARHPA